MKVVVSIIKKYHGSSVTCTPLFNLLVEQLSTWGRLEYENVSPLYDTYVTFVWQLTSEIYSIYIVKVLSNTHGVGQKDEIPSPCQSHTWSTGFKCKDRDEGPLLTISCIPSSPLWKGK